VSTRRFESLGFGLHYDNMAMMGGDDIILPSIGGAGSSLLGNILVELGLNYVDPTKVRLLPDGRSVPPDDDVTNRVRTRRAPGAGNRTLARTWPRFAKTHLPAQEYGSDCFGAVWLLVRDPRDALYSWYRYHRAFAERAWERVPASFDEFLSRPFFTTRPPVGTWCSFHRGWLRRMRGLSGSVVLRFEQLKTDPYPVIRHALREVRVEVSDHDLARAINLSTFESMRAHEEAVVGASGDDAGARVARRGQVAEWTEWMTPGLRRHFQSRELATVAGQFGCGDPPVPIAFTGSVDGRSKPAAAAEL
jgi:hypothetical protein